MIKTAFWKTLYTVGSDTAFLSEAEGGWYLRGTAVHLNEGVPTAISYALDLATDWSTRSGSFDGFVGGKSISRRIERDGAEWVVNGERQRGLNQLVDIDFGFTPATNYPQLRRMALEIGQSAEITVAWCDVDSTGLEPLPQIYRRVAEHAYDYSSPQGPYRATLQIASTGFVSVYPDLWESVETAP